MAPSVIDIRSSNDTTPPATSESCAQSCGRMWESAKSQMSESLSSCASRTADIVGNCFEGSGKFCCKRIGAIVFLTAGITTIALSSQLCIVDDKCDHDRYGNHQNSDIAGGFGVVVGGFLTLCGIAEAVFPGITKKAMPGRH